MRTAIYCRVSTPGQKNTTSLPEQERITREKAARLGWEVSEPHVYREVMGGEDLYRPQMDKLWDAILRHEIDALVVDVLDRLSRDEGDVGAVYHHCDRYGVRIELASEDLDESEHGRNLRTLAGIMGRMERADIRRRTQRGRRARAVGGKLLVGPFPLYGYRWGDPDKGQRTYYIVDPETGWVVVRIFERVAAGVPIRTLCRQLEAEGIPTPGQVLAARGQLPKGKTAYALWKPGMIHRIVKKTPAYWGGGRAYHWHSHAEKVRPHDTGITRKRRVATERRDDDPLCVALPASTCPALVSVELAARAQARLRVNQEEWSGRPVADPLATLWRGMAVCGHCGGRLRTLRAPGTANTRRYRCQGIHADPTTGTRTPCPGGAMSINATQLDPLGWADVRIWLSDPANVERLLRDWQEQSARNVASAGSRLAAVEATLADLRQKMAELGTDIDETTQRESRRVLLAQLDAHAVQLEQEEAKRAQIMREGETASEQAAAALGLRERIQRAAVRAARADPAQQRALLRALGAEVTLWRADYQHPDGWPQRYKIRLHWTGWTSGQSPEQAEEGYAPITLPPSQPALQLSSTTRTSYRTSATTCMGRRAARPMLR
jgi:site-specific DNA recombinase